MKGAGRARLLVSALAACVAIAAASGANASATVIGLNEGGSWDFNAVKHSGAELFRVEIAWKTVVDHGNWRQAAAWEQSYDPIVEQAAKNEVSLLGLLYGRGTETSLRQFYLSSEWGEYLEFVSTAVQRYGRGGSFWALHPSLPYRPITVWEVWNEPNLAANNPGAKQALPQKYAEFLIACSNTIKSAQNAVRKAGEPADTVVLHGGLYQWDAGMSVGEFVEKASKISGYGGAFNGFGLHPYSFHGSEAEKLSEFKQNVSNARVALQAAGLHQPIWITELGWPVGGSEEPTVGEAEQASLLKSAFNWAKTGEYNVAEITWYNFHDFATSKWEGSSGLLRPDDSFRPAWFAFQEETGAPRWPVPPPPVLAAFVDAGNANSLTAWEDGSVNGWQQEPLWGHEVAAGTNPVILRYEETTHIFFVDGSRGNRITEWSWNSVTGWQQSFLETDSVAANSSPSAVIVNGRPEIFFSDAATNRELTTLVRNNGGWEQIRFFGDPVAENSSPSAINYGGSAHVYFADASKGNTISVWVWTWGVSLQQSFFGGDPVAANSSPSAIATSGSAQVFFADGAKSNTVSGWVWNSVLQPVYLQGDPLPANSSPSAIDSGGTTEVFMADASKGNTMTVWIWGASLQQVNLSGDPITPNSSPVAVPNNGEPRIYFSDEATNNSMSLWEWGPTYLRQNRLFGHPIKAGTSPGA